MAGETTETTTTEAQVVTGLSQDQVNEIVSREKAKATEKSQKDMLAQFGVGSAEEVTNMVKSFKEWEASKLSAEERAVTLTSERDALKVRADASEAAVQQVLEAEIAAIDESKRGMIPEYDSPSKVLAWITKNRAALTDKPAPANAGGGGSPALSDGSTPVDFDTWKSLGVMPKIEFQKNHPETANSYLARLQSSI